MKRAWTRGEKRLWASPLLFGLAAIAVIVMPGLLRRALGWPESLMTTPDTVIRSMAVSGNGEILAAAGRRGDARGWKQGSGTIYLWNARTAQPLPSIPPIYRRVGKGVTGWDIYALTLSPDAKQIGLRGVGEKSWALYDVATQKQLWRFPKPVSDAEFSRDGRFIALFSELQISIVEARSGRMHAQWKESDSASYGDLAWSPNGNWIASITGHKNRDAIELHRVDTGKLVRRIQGTKSIGSETMASVAFSPDSRQIIVAASIGSYSSTDNFSMVAPVRCYEAKTGSLLWEVKAPALGGASGNYAAFCDAIFSPDGRIVAAYQYLEGRVFLLDSATGAIKTTLKIGNAGRSGFVVPPGLAFSSDGKRLFARGKNAVLFWDLK